jgi:HD-GYP domain-containing protein (c-di-GMP phosphodiesterase class II)
MWDALPNQMRMLVEELRDNQDAAGRIGAFANALTALVDQDVDIALYHAVRQENADLFFYGYNHSIQTAVLCLLMARRLGWPEARILSLMCAAITMNLPVLALQGQMAKQDVPMRESQKHLIRQHPQGASDWLQKAGVTDTEWLAAVAQHHERSDGSGYHLGLTQIAEMAVALRVTDVFMAKISPRFMRAPLSIREAAKQLYAEDKGGPLSGALIKEFGIYPPGEVVKLVSGEVCVVMRRSANTKCPLVACITDVSGRPAKQTLQRDTSQAVHAIAGSAPPPATIARLPPERIYGYASAAASANPH